MTRKPEPHDHELHLQIEAVFFHVPKAAGSAFRQLIAPYSNFHYQLMDESYADHMGRRYILGEVPAAFTCVRNPFERLAACFQIWRHRRGEGMSPGHAVHVANQLWMKVDNDHPLRNDYQFWRHTRPASPFVHARDIQVIRFENLKEDWGNLATYFGIPSDLPMVNPTHPAIQPGYYRELFAGHESTLKRLYEKDCEAWGYEW